MLQVLDDGRLTDGQGRVVSFKNTIIIMTSNVGSQLIQEYMENGNKAELDKGIEEALRKTFRPEFINRIDEVITFSALGVEDLEKIVDLQLAKVRERLADRRIELRIEPDALKHLAEQGFDPAFGARPLKRLIQHQVVDRAANEIVQGNLVEGDTIVVGLDGDDYIVHIEH